MRGSKSSIGIPLLWGFLALTLGKFLPLLELQMQALFVGWRPAQSPPPEIVIVAIDELSLAQTEKFPWQRKNYALAIDRLMQAGAKVVALDLLFVNPSIYGAEDDRKFLATLLRYQDRLVLASSYEVSASQEGKIERRLSPRDIFPQLEQKVEGFVNLPIEADGTIHRLPQLPTGEKTFVGAILHQAGVTVSPASKYINYLGRAETWVRSGQQYPFSYLLEQQNWQGILQNGQVFRDKIVLIGATAPSLQDIQPSPLGPMAGVEIHAHALATILQNRSVTFLTAPWLLLVWLFFCAYALQQIPQPQYQFAAAIILALLAVVTSFILWQTLYLFLPIGKILITTLGMGTTYLVTGVIQEQLARQKLRRTLDIYVAAPIVAEILQQPDSYYEIMAGKAIEAVVMFCDIRGFTAIAQMLPPQVLVQQLNQYLSAMVASIIAHQGTVDKFIGDAIMAEFGSPLSRGKTQDVMAGIKASLAMRLALHQLRKTWRQQGQIPFFHGIGLHFGEVIVGNIGSPQRLEYAVIGDTVNTASRIESMTKELGFDIVISETVYAIAQDKIVAVDLGQQQLRGRTTPIRLYGLVSLRGEDDSLFQAVQREWQEYRGKNFYEYSC